MNNACITCKHWDPQGAAKVNKKVAGYGYGLCKLEKWPFDRARMFSSRALCNKQKYEQAGVNVVNKRREFFGEVNE